MKEIIDSQQSLPETSELSPFDSQSQQEGQNSLQECPSSEWIEKTSLNRPEEMDITVQPFSQP